MMRTLKKAVLGASLATLLGGVMAIPASATPASAVAATTQVTAETSPQLARGWNYSGPYATERECVITKELRRAGGYPVEPSSGCYRAQSGYYFLWYTD